MAELLEVEQRKRLVHDTCLGGKITRIEVRKDEPLRGISADELQAKLANSHLVNIQRKGKNLVLITDRGSSLLFSMNEDADLSFQESPVTEHATDARIILHFDNGNTLDFRFPSLRDRFYFFPSTDLATLPPLQAVGPEPAELTYPEFRERLKTCLDLPIHAILTSQQYLSGIGPAFADEICFQAGIRPDRRLGDLLHSEWESLYEQMQAVLRKAEEVQGDQRKLDQLGFLMPRRGTDRACPRCGGALEVLHFGNVRSYFCPHCQDGQAKEAKKMRFW